MAVKPREWVLGDFHPHLIQDLEHYPLICISGTSAIFNGSFPRHLRFTESIDGIDPIEVLLVHGALTWFYQPQSSNSIACGSAAQYLAAGRIGNWSVLLQHLPPHSRTSWHYHKGSQETFIPLSGWCGVCLHHKDVDGKQCYETMLDAEQGNSMHVEPGTPHVLYTCESPAINLILMTDRSEPFDSSDHHYLPFPVVS